ncbi:LD-carboxypeptidase [Desulfobacterales bacterium HSG16]|nr:LD-carboxypeptidase [Desulfobacterales bacterium HSG16]
MKIQNFKKKVPKPLEPGDTIAVAAPASSFSKDRFDAGVSVLKSFGFKVVIPDEIFMKKGYLAGSDRHRAQILNSLFADNKINGIACARGGFGSMRILHMLDSALIYKNPKIFIGFSDITAILSFLYQKCGMAVLHGPVIVSLADADFVTRDFMYQALTFEKKLDIFFENSISITKGRAYGPVFGGNLTTLCHLLGTSYMPDVSGHILFIEDRAEASYRIDRMLTHMKLAGCFDNLAGVILGTFTDCGKPDEILKITKNIFSNLKIPVLTGVDIGHGVPNITIPFGIDACLDTEKSMISFNVDRKGLPSINVSGNQQ